MRKQRKLIVSAIMAVVMLMTISTTAMAAEQVPVVEETEVMFQENDVSVAPASVWAVDDIYNDSSVRLYAECVLTTSLHLSEASRTVQHKVVGYSDTTRGQAVIFRFTNNSTGETRSFTAVADGTWHADSYNTSFPAGYYTLKVIYVGATGYYGVNIIYLP